MPGDANVDGFVDEVDEMILMNNLMAIGAGNLLPSNALGGNGLGVGNGLGNATAKWSEGDFDCSGTVDISDLMLLMQYMSQDCFSTTPDTPPSF